MHTGFSAFNGGTSLGSVGLGVSPKEVNVPGMGIVGMQKGETPPEDLASKQCVLPTPALIASSGSLYAPSLPYPRLYARLHAVNDERVER